MNDQRRGRKRQNAEADANTSQQHPSSPISRQINVDIIDSGDDSNNPSSYFLRSRIRNQTHSSAALNANYVAPPNVVVSNGASSSSCRAKNPRLCPSHTTTDTLPTINGNENTDSFSERQRQIHQQQHRLWVESRRETSDRYQPPSSNSLLLGGSRRLLGGSRRTPTPHPMYVGHNEPVFNNFGIGTSDPLAADTLNDLQNRIYNVQNELRSAQVQMNTQITLFENDITNLRNNYANLENAVARNNLTDREATRARAHLMMSQVESIADYVNRMTHFANQLSQEVARGRRVAAEMRRFDNYLQNAIQPSAPVTFDPLAALAPTVSMSTAHLTAATVDPAQWLSSHRYPIFPPPSTVFEHPTTFTFHPPPLPSVTYGLYGHADHAYTNATQLFQNNSGNSASGRDTATNLAPVLSDEDITMTETLPATSADPITSSRNRHLMDALRRPPTPDPTAVPAFMHSIAEDNWLHHFSRSAAQTARDITQSITFNNGIDSSTAPSSIRSNPVDVLNREFIPFLSLANASSVPSMLSSSTAERAVQMPASRNSNNERSSTIERVRNTNAMPDHLFENIIALDERLRSLQERIQMHASAMMGPGGLEQQEIERYTSRFQYSKKDNSTDNIETTVADLPGPSNEATPSATETASATNTNNTAIGEIRSNECTICMVDFETGDNLRKLPCVHDFHIGCIDRWLLTNKTCPNCRAPIDGSRINEFEHTLRQAFPGQSARLSLPSRTSHTTQRRVARSRPTAVHPTSFILNHDPLASIFQQDRGREGRL